MTEDEEKRVRVAWRIAQSTFDQMATNKLETMIAFLKKDGLNGNSPEQVATAGFGIHTQAWLKKFAEESPWIVSQFKKT